MTNAYNLDQKQLTKDSILGALLIIMDKKEFKKISISEVSQKAGVSRMAFYRNYEILEDVLMERLDTINRAFVQVIDREHVNNYEMTKRYFSHMKSHKDFLMKLFDAGLTQLVLDQLIAFLEELSEYLICDIECTPEYRKYNIKFIAGGIFNVLLTWCQGGMVESVDQMATLICERFSNHITKLAPIN
ncbi:TetR/AcrR family transcriptional regulator [Enterococcus pseudoavium]|uniref:TetR/AcrR family transcriptional regulator n=1 Tax=Enterococcus pseudoavium TaxID=44007 RepID=UPI00288F1844|nr:TetR/AcrR family transcriptional regulator [Enterococcus pseudoavium]MDT2754496.1 TetR/AcrR family transcriptional regulator [Enterococcus pseudoavium]